MEEQVALINQEESTMLFVAPVGEIILDLPLLLEVGLLKIQVQIAT